ncbi:glutathione S-transferase family protein [Pelagibius marinus]|uniref:glutathione S-transferase family protein n=1 Tax=Pelagibius marinus TaxID=2762760 RepID=UPI0018727FB8|nr:glutathione S-transferase family protein [Pelagibius marinus]
MLKLYDDPDSGNGYKVLLTLALLDIPYDLVEVNAIQGETRKEAFLAKNPNGRIPLLELDDGTLLPESNAIMFYLAEGTPYLPDDRLGRARALQWMFFEQYSHEPYIAVLRYWTRHTDKTRESEPQWAEREQRGYDALGVMEKTLAGQDWLLGAQPSIADISLYAYTHVADQGGFDLSAYPALRAWIERFPGLPGYVPFAGRLKAHDDRKA